MFSYTRAMADVCPTEDAVEALLEYLVDPLLPVKSLLRETPSQSQQQSIAKQVYAVVLLYNYYHRKQYPKLEFLGFESFCKLAVVLRPALLAHLTFMQGSNDIELEDLDKKFSITEKMIVDACNVSKSLDASREVPYIEGWPISKVAVLLVDSKKENCFLLFSSITQGVWSVFQKDVDVLSQSSEGTVEAKNSDKKRRVMIRNLRVESKINEAALQQLAYLAVKEATGISQTDLLVLENHLVYSVSKEKTATRFYIMMCTEAVNKDVNQVPIKDAIDRFTAILCGIPDATMLCLCNIFSLQGPLIRKSFGRWTVTPVVEYFHVLPYVGIFSEWICRQEHLNIFQDSRVGNILEWPEDPCKTEIHKSRKRSHVNDDTGGGLGSKISGVDSESSTLKGTYGVCKIGLPHALSEPHIFQNGKKCNHSSNITEADDHANVLPPFHAGSDVNSSASYVDVKQFETMDSTIRSTTTMCRAMKASHGDNVSGYISSDQDGIGARSPATYQSKSKDLEELQITLTSKENKLSQTALKVLISRRDILSLQLRHLEDEIAQCDKKIQTILNDIEKQRKCIVEEQVYMFLARLDRNLDQVSSRVLATPLPSLEETYSVVRHEEQRQLTMRTEDCSEASALAVHTDDVCWKKHGYLEWYKLKQAERKKKKSTQVALTDTSPCYASHMTRSSSKEGNSGSAFISAAGSTWDNLTKITIDIGRERGGLYNLERTTDLPSEHGHGFQHILKVALALCFTMHVPNRFWAEAFITAVFLINGMPACIIDYQTPLRMSSHFHIIPSALNLCLKVNAMCLWMCNSVSKNYLSEDVSLIPFQGEMNSKEEECLSLEEKRSERPARLFQKGYTRKNKDAIVMPPIFDNPLDESTMPSDDSSKINLEFMSLELYGEDDLALKIDSIIEGCNDVCLRSSAQDRIYQLEDQFSARCIKKKRLSEAILNKRSPCQAIGILCILLYYILMTIKTWQELDGVCDENNWILPTYRVFLSEGGFRASVTVRGADFEFTSEGDLHLVPRGARESAAAQMMVKLHHMAGQA
ncbi:hypothetical protein FEM48_Zijuj07G0019700 [Ziziphus jujuba var. spinosa]|uniref:Uncharacterized protein n=1 Tax=Ziziphus jujuba var. spinosa TaxID=714518 RepID=A0A978V1S9_ZIZJJ|nr:hypothetical protein FEM48_Zijuj07G0019700 [Ziziphus jujuba var. spinosa]